MATESVNHPKHYNSHPNGIECIDIIRHYVCDIANAIKYLWRAGLKPEMGMEDAEKEIEDLKKALWYIEDYRNMCHAAGCQHRQLGCAASVVLYTLTGHNIGDVVKGYEKNVAAAISGLLRVGIISVHTAYAVEDWEYWLDNATKAIQQRISDIKNNIKDLSYGKNRECNISSAPCELQELRRNRLPLLHSVRL